MRYVKTVMMICVMGLTMTAMAAGGGPEGSANPLQDRLAALSATDRADPPARNGVEFTGSSMFEGWTDVAAHMAPLPAFNRAIGGSKTGDILSHLDQLVLQYAPKVVVLYSGINDVSEGISSETAAENIRKIVEGIQAALPGTRVIYIAILNTSNRPDSMAAIGDANARVQAYAQGNSLLTYLDVSAALVDEKGETRPEFLTSDNAHYNATAYEAMATVVKPVVEKIWSE